MAMRSTVFFAGLGAVLSAVAMVSTGAAIADEPEKLLAQIADGCTAAHGYDPRRPGAVDETDLADNERPWRACMHAGITAKILPGSPVAVEWRTLLDADTRMTDDIPAGSMTRSQRAARLQMLIANVRLAGIAATDRSVRQVQQNREILDEIERIRNEAPRFF